MLPETIQDASTTGDSRPAQPGILLAFCAKFPVYQWVPLEGGKLTIGRGRIPGLELDGKLSREHAEIEVSGKAWIIRDHASRNGTWVDGVPVQGEAPFEDRPRVLRFGSTIAIPWVDGWRALTLPLERRGEIIVGPTLRVALQSIERAAAAGHNVFIAGESGAGKELAARTFHAAGPSKAGPFVAVNCATIPEGVAERLLVGSRRGAFSGAADSDGYLQAAHGGVLFLDELGELELEVQAKLLRILETKEVVPLGATKGRQLDVRFCFATNRDLRRAIADGGFREDLYYRVAQPEVALPPLRERLEEIPWHIAAETAAADASLAVSAEMVEACMLRTWPGNVRELRAEIRRAAHDAIGAGGATLKPSHLRAEAGMSVRPSVPPLAVAAPVSVAAGPSVPDKRAEITRESLEAALRDHPSAVAAARALGIHRSHLYRLMKQHGIGRDDDQ